MLNKFKIPILILILITLFLPTPASAILGTGLFDVFKKMLGGIEEITVKITFLLFFIVFFYLLGLALLDLSSRYLEFFINNQGAWISQLGEMTRIGWDFIVGLANMLLILIFLIIAFAFIFKIETFQAKKALPTLILVALLLNFSLLFVYMLVDITQFLYNTILNALPGNDLPDNNTNLFTHVMDVLIAPFASIISMGLGLIGAIAVAWAVPIANAFAQVGFAIAFTGLFLPNFIIWAVQGFFIWSLVIMFFAFIILFGARVFVIQFLAILTPLAFLCLILPQTKKFWSEWFKTLMNWLILGIFFLFFLALGFSMLHLLKPEIPAVDILTAVPGFAWFRIGDIIIYYLVLIIYLMVILYIGKKYIPQGAQGVIGFIEGASNLAITRGLKPLATGASRWVERGAISHQADRESKKAKKYEAEAEALKKSDEPDKDEKIASWTRRAEAARTREASLKEKLLEEERAKLLQKAPKEPEHRINYLRGEMLKEEGRGMLGNHHKIAAAIDILAKEGKIGSTEERFVKAAVRRGVDPDRILKRRPDLAPKIVQATNPERIEKLKQDPSGAEINQTVIKEALSKVPPEDLRKNIQKEAVRNKHVVRHIIEDKATNEEFAKSAKMEIKQEIGKTILKNWEMFDKSPLKETVWDMIKDPKWPIEWPGTEEKKEESIEERLKRMGLHYAAR